jgi:hypothetical protein
VTARRSKSFARLPSNCASTSLWVRVGCFMGSSDWALLRMARPRSGKARNVSGRWPTRSPRSSGSPRSNRNDSSNVVLSLAKRLEDSLTRLPRGSSRFAIPLGVAYGFPALFLGALPDSTPFGEMVLLGCRRAIRLAAAAPLQDFSH